MHFLAHHLGWLVVCGLLLHFFVFPAWGGPRVSALDRKRRDAREVQR